MLGLGSERGGGRGEGGEGEGKGVMTQHPALSCGRLNW